MPVGFLERDLAQGNFSMATLGDREVFQLGQTGRFALPDERHVVWLASPRCGATMAMIFFSSPATLTGLEEKKTGPSRFIADFFRLFFRQN